MRNLVKVTLFDFIRQNISRNMADFQQILLKLTKNLNILREREAKYAGNEPLDLLNQIDDHQQAISLTRQAITGELTEAEWTEATETLLLALNQGQAANIEAETYVAGDQIIHYHYHPEEKQADPKPHLSFEPEVIEIPAGPFLMGCDDGLPHEGPCHRVTLPAYAIGQYPITNQQYAEFIHQSRRVVDPATGWEGLTPPHDKLMHPVLGVTWSDALTYCQWLSQQSGRPYSLPSEAEWEKAARGDDGRLYPWGNNWEPDCCNHGSNDTTPVNAFSNGASPYGCMDMVGNGREWTTTLWGQRMAAPDPEYRYPWLTDGRRDNVAAPLYIYRVYRGGSFNDNQTRLRCYARQGFDPRQTGQPRRRHGFRVMLKL